MPPEEAAPSEDTPDIASDTESSAPESTDSSPAPESAADSSPLGVFRSHPGFESASDEEIVARLQETMQREQQAYRALQQYQTIVPAASEYLSNRELYEQWKQSRSQPQYQQPVPQAPQAPQKDEWWNPPKVKDVYRQYLTRDEHGREVIAENAPLEARHALAEHQAYKAEFARKLLENPRDALGPMVEQIVAERAREIAESQITGLKEETYISQIEQENRDWLYDGNGNVSREGLLVQKYIEDARGQGIQGAKARWEYATAMVERDLALANLQAYSQYRQPAPVAPQQQAPQAPQEPTPAQKNMEFLRQQATRTAPRRAQPTTDPRTPKKPMTFAERMISNLQQTGLE